MDTFAFSSSIRSRFQGRVVSEEDALAVDLYLGHVLSPEESYTSDPSEVVCTESLVSILSGAVSPHAVFWRIWAIVVGSFNRVLLGWGYPHILKEENEAIPPITDSYASAPVTNIRVVVGVLAPNAHTTPHSVFKSICQTMIFSFHNTSMPEMA